MLSLGSPRSDASNFTLSCQNLGTRGKQRDQHRPSSGLQASPCNIGRAYTAAHRVVVLHYTSSQLICENSFRAFIIVHSVLFRLCGALWGEMLRIVA